MRKFSARFLAFILVLCSVLLLCDTTAYAATKKRPKLNIKKLDMTLGSTFCLRMYNVKKKHQVTFTSSNPEIVSLKTHENRKRINVVAQSIGTSTVTATVTKGTKIVRRQKCRIKVSPVGMSIKFPRKKIKLNLSDQFVLEPIIKPNTSTEQPIFESDNPNVVRVSPLGVVTALAPGSATITATLLSTNQTAKCKVIVKPLPEDDEDEEDSETNMKITLETITIYEG